MMPLPVTLINLTSNSPTVGSFQKLTFRENIVPHSVKETLI